MSERERGKGWEKGKEWGTMRGRQRMRSRLRISAVRTASGILYQM
jgi:hypothetical protein